MLQVLRNNGHGHTDTDAVAEEFDELFPDDDVKIQTSMDATQRISTIRLLEQQIEQLTRQDQESRNFYADRKAKVEARIEDIKRNILGYLQFNNLKNIQTPVGTAYQKVVTIKHWPEDEVLLAWGLAHNPATIRVKREPDKRLISDHIRSTGEIPETYSESQETRLYIR